MVTKKLMRVKAQSLLRKTGLLAPVERLRYYYKCLSYRNSNKAFCDQNPGFILPPQDLAFDAYSAPAWNFYKTSGEESAKFLKAKADQHLPGRTVSAIYEWGCGPGRVVRQLRAQFGDAVEIYGTDYNPATIAWCKQNLPGIHFSLNGLMPPLEIPDNKMDLTYCCSVFTHLSASTCVSWANEVFRVLKPGGIFIASTRGDHSFETELLPDERETYRTDGVVERGKYEEGKKMFLTSHSPDYVRQTLLSKFEIVEHLPAGFPRSTQDCWIARKPSAA